MSEYHLIDSKANEDFEPHVHRPRPWSQTPVWQGLITITLIASALLNGAFLSGYFRHDHLEKSRYALLDTSKTVPFKHRTGYASSNITEAQELWDAINFDTGIVAIPQAEAAAMNAPPSQPFPWDTSKSIYVLNGYHALHCLKIIQLSLYQAHTSVPLSYPYLHTLHCLDSLRGDILCNADDTPRYTTPDKTPITGEDQPRQCRDWSKLEAWAKERSACWEFDSVKAYGRNELERYLHCEKGTKDWERMNEWVEAKARGEEDEIYVGTPGVSL